MTDNSTLKITSFNCKGFRARTHQYVQKLFDNCDFLLVQEHWLLSKQFDHFSKYVKGACYTADTEMADDNLGPGRPHGGTAILWHDNLNCKVDIINTISGRLSSVLVTNGNKQYLLVTVYMPPYDAGSNCVDVYGDILAEISQLSNTHSDANVLVMGDWNTDFKRNNRYNDLLNTFLLSDDLKAAYHVNDSPIEFTYISPDGLSRSYIDHLLLDNEMFNHLSEYVTLNEGDNTSDHLPVVATFNVPKLEMVESVTPSHKKVINWSKAEQHHITNYQCTLDRLLGELTLPTTALACKDVNCKLHSEVLLDLFDKVSQAICIAGKESIPLKKSGKPKCRPGWNEHVSEAKNKSMFWNTIWKDSGCPRVGWVAMIRRRCRAEYHRAIKKIKKEKDSIIRSKVARCIYSRRFCNFWVEIKKIKISSKKSTNVMDNVSGKSDICNLFQQKYESLYNSPVYSSDDLGNNINLAVSNGCTNECNSIKHVHSFQPAMISRAIKKLKSNSYDSAYDLSSNNLVNGTPYLVTLLSLCFSAFLSHGLSPSLLNSSCLVPIPKKLQGFSIPV